MSESDEEGLNAGSLARDLPPWSACNVFCIHAYAGAAVRACGWRGRVDERDVDRAVCPRCGRATLMRLPSDQRDCLL